MATITKTTTVYAELQAQIPVAAAENVQQTFDLSTAISGTVYVKHDTLQTPDANTLIQIYESHEGATFLHLAQSLEIDDANDPGYSTPITLVGGRKYSVKVTNQDSTDSRNITIESSKTASYTVA